MRKNSLALSTIKDGVIKNYGTEKVSEVIEVHVDSVEISPLQFVTM
jgi:hypothetical protein